MWNDPLNLTDPSGFFAMDNDAPSVDMTGNRPLGLGSPFLSELYTTRGLSGGIPWVPSARQMMRTYHSPSMQVPTEQRSTFVGAHAPSLPSDELWQPNVLSDISLLVASSNSVDASLSTANVVLGATRATGLSPTEMRLLHLLARGNRDEARLIYREVLAKGQVNPKVRAIAERAFGRTGEKSLERLAKKWDELYAGRSRVKGLEKQLEAAKGKRARDELK